MGTLKLIRVVYYYNTLRNEAIFYTIFWYQIKEHIVGYSLLLIKIIFKLIQN